MSGFVQRFGYYPGVEVITQIEGVVIVDLPPPGATDGVSTGVVAIVGEWADMTYATSVDGSGVVTTRYRPQEVFTSQDLINKFGGFDETIGDFGVSDGNGYVAIRNKRYSRLVVAPVNLCSSKGVRFFRQLPLNTSPTNTLPVVPVQGGTIPAGREFRGPSNGRLRIGARTVFTAFDPITAGIQGSTTNTAAAATQSFTVAGADFTAVQRPDGSTGIKKGDIIVIGNNNAGALEPLPASGNLGAGTYRVAADAVSGSPTVLSLESLNGANFAFVSATSIPYRIHVSSDADSAPVVVLGNSAAGGYAAADVGGYSVPVRPLTNESGNLVDGTWAAGSLLNPLIVPPALTGDSCDPLSGLSGRIIPTGGLDYVAAVQKSNAANVSAIDAQYVGAINSLVSEVAPLSEISVVFSARSSDAINNKLKSHALDASTRTATGRMAIIRPRLSTQDVNTVVSATAPGVGANRNARVIYAWPGAQAFIPEAVGFRLKVATGLTTADGNLDVGSDAYVASILSNLPPERNPAQSAEPVPTLLSSIIGFQRGVTKLELPDYIALRQNGVMALKIDPTVGPVFQSGITTSLTRVEKNVLTRRMTDFLQATMAKILLPFCKLPLTQQNKDNALIEIDAFLTTLKSEGNPAAQRIVDYRLDDKSGNTPDTSALGIHVIIVRVQLIPSGDFIVLQTEVGETVNIQPVVA